MSAVRRLALFERLEPRTLLSSAFPNVNVSRMSGNQAEGAIAVDRADPKRLFAVSNIDVGDGLMVAASSDGGATWARRTIANDSDGLPPACCDPSASFDAYGNLFLAYLNSKGNQVEVLLSTDAGQSFALIAQYNGNVDQPTVTTGPGSVWLTFDRSGGVAATGAADTGLGSIGQFGPARTVRGSGGGSFGDIAIGPAGQVIVAYEKDGGSSRSRLYLNDDPAGLAGTFGKPVLVSTTAVGDFDHIPAQPTRGIDAEIGLAFDRSGGPFTGRVYAVYTDEIPAGSGNTDIFLRYSDNQGITWSNPIRVNDDTGANSQFLPRVSLDNTTGKVAVSWYDSRNDLGTGGAGDVDGVPNNDAQFFATVVTPQIDGLKVASNQQVSAGVSSAADANSTIDLGDYTGLDFYNGVLHPFWFDNSNSTGDNPNGAHKGLNAYTANVSASAFSDPPAVSLGGLTEPSGPVPALWLHDTFNNGVLRSGRAYTITVAYADGAGLNPSTFSDANLLITGPKSFSAPAQFVRAHPRGRGGTLWLATYRVVNAAGAWSASNNGTYTITLQGGQVADPSGHAAPAGILGTFVVDV